MIVCSIYFSYLPIAFIVMMVLVVTRESADLGLTEITESLNSTPPLPPHTSPRSLIFFNNERPIKEKMVNLHNRLYTAITYFIFSQHFQTVSSHPSLLHTAIANQTKWFV